MAHNGGTHARRVGRVVLVAASAMILLLVAVPFARAQESEESVSAVLASALQTEQIGGGTLALEEAQAAGDGPPLPLHTIEGVGGIVLTPMAYLVNPGPPGTTVGKPAAAVHFAMIGSKDLEAATLTWTFFRRLELGYAANRLGLDDFPSDVQTATGVDIGTDDVFLHHFNARLNIIEENQWDQNWIPAVTFGAHYKYNEDINDIDGRLGGALTGLGLDDDDGLDFTGTASKTVTFLSRPVIVSAGARASRAAQLRFVGFTDEYSLTFEGGAVMLVTDRLGVGAEYRQKPEALGEVPGLLGDEDSWWDVHAAYIINDQATVSATIGDLGTVLNHTDETLLGIVFKYEF